MIYSESITFESEGSWYSINITEQVRTILKHSGLKQGIILIFYQHTTGGVMVIEHEAGFLADLEDNMERLIPSNGAYKHHLRGVDRNGAAHVRTAIIPTSVVLPVQSGNLALGEYQDILVVDMQPELKMRSVLIQVMGE
jgi:secondary thiamine-phosphate synthase enzyme